MHNIYTFVYAPLLFITTKAFLRSEIQNKHWNTCTTSRDVHRILIQGGSRKRTCAINYDFTRFTPCRNPLKAKTALCEYH